MVTRNPFAAYVDEERRKWRIANGLPVDDPRDTEETVAVVDEAGRQKWGPNWEHLKSELGARFQDIQTGAEIGAGAIANAAAEITGPGPLDSFVPFLRNYQQNLDRELGEQPGFIGKLGAFGEAERQTDMPSVNVDVIPGSGINLPGSRTLNRVDLGVKGALELAGDPLNLIGGVPKAAKAVREGVEATGRGAAKAGAALERQGFPSPISVADATTAPIPVTAVAPPTAPAAVVQAVPASPKGSFDPYGLGENRPGLTRYQRLKNSVREITGQGIQDDAELTPAMENRARIMRVGETQKDVVANEVRTALKEAAFDLDDSGRIRSLAGIDPENPSGPIFSSLAARLPIYEQSLSPAQKAAVQRVQDALAPYSGSLDKVGVKYGQREDIIDGGFYFPRTADLSDDVRSALPTGKKGTGSYRKTARYEQAEQGLQKGVEYLSPDDAARGYISQVTRDVADYETGGYVRSLGVGSDAAERVALAQTPKEREIARYTPRNMALTELKSLESYAIPTKQADVIKKYMQRETDLAARTAIRNTMQAAATTGDNSWAGIQGLLGMYDDPKSFGKALIANTRSWTSGDVVRESLETANRQARTKGLPEVRELARYGLNLAEGGASIQDVRLSSRIRGLPVLKQASRAFETGGITQRLHGAYEIIEEEIKQGRTVQDLIQSGDMQKIMTQMNRLTGVADTPAGGNLGGQLLFAGRFLQARLSNVTRGVMGLRSFDTRDVAPFLPNVHVGPKTPIDQRYARRALLRMIGLGTTLTVLANEVQGNDTDFRPIVNGKPNANFMRIRVGNRDFSIFGPYDSLLRLVGGTGTGVATGNFGEAVKTGRGLIAPDISLAWDLLTGEDAVGNPVPKITDLKTEDLPELGKTTGERFIPIAARNAPETLQQVKRGIDEGKPVEVASGALGTTAELSGYKTSPLGFVDEADKIAKSMFKKGYYDLPEGSAQRTAVRNRMYQTAPRVLLRFAENDFKEYQFRRLAASEVNQMKSSLMKLKQSPDADVKKRATEILKAVAEEDQKRKSGNSGGVFPVGSRSSWGAP